MARRRRTRNSAGLGFEPVTTALAVATTLAPAVLPFLANLFGGEKKEGFHFAPSTYEKDYAAALERKKQEALAQVQLQQIQQAQREAKETTRSWLVYGAIAVGVLAGSAILITLFSRRKSNGRK